MGSFSLTAKEKEKICGSSVDLDRIRLQKESTSKSVHWVDQLTLKEKEILLGGDWLNDNLIDASQRLIKRQYILTLVDCNM